MYIGIDIGGTSTRIGLFQQLATPDFTLLARFPTRQSYEQQVAQISTSLQQGNLSDIAGIGISVGGQVTQDGRSVAVAPNLPAYVGKPLVLDLQSQWSCPVRLAHDTICGLLSEKKFGPILPYDRCAFLTLSTGTGAAIQLRKASTTLTVSIEIGHQLLDGNPLLCLCGQRGCLETYTGGRQLELRLGQSIAEITDRAFWQTYCEKLALGLVNLTHLTRVEAIALSGAIALHNDFLLPLLQQHVTSLLRQDTSLTLLPAALGENSPLVGAVTLLEVAEDTILH